MNVKTIIPLSCHLVAYNCKCKRHHLQKVPIIMGSVWEKFGVLHRCSVMRPGDL